jgi:hypothetical protein
MSFQDVGAGTRPPRPMGPRGGAGASVARVGLGGAGAAPVGGGGAGDPLRDVLSQYQSNIALFEKLGKTIGMPKDSAEVRKQIRAQEGVVQVRELPSHDHVSHTRPRNTSGAYHDCPCSSGLSQFLSLRFWGRVSVWLV